MSAGISGRRGVGWARWMGGIAVMVWGIGWQLHGAALPRDEGAISGVAAGRLAEARAVWWGFDAGDATEAVQSAINSKAKRVVIPFVGAPWVLRPVTLRSDLELVFEPGVLVLAKPGEFRGGGDCLFRAVDATNLVVRGYGATLRMRKDDYQQSPYVRAEWRMGLSFTGCRDVRVEGLRIESSGGDGIYVGSSRDHRWCENVEIRDCVCHDHHRQGLSVISAVNLKVERCVFSGTAGTPPEAGIDLEPDSADERLVNCVFRDCVVSDNRGNGVLVYLKPLDATSEPVSIRFENCHVRMGPPGATVASLGVPEELGWSGYAVLEAREKGPRGWIEFVRCSSENTGREAVRVMNKAADGVRVRFVECWWKSTWLARHRSYAGPRVPVLIRSTAVERCRESGGVEFENCHLEDDREGPVVQFEDEEGTASVRDVTGTLRVVRPGGGVPVARWGSRAEGVTLRLLPGEGDRR